MSITVPRWRFTETMVRDAPDWKGVYVLWSQGTPLAVGQARGGDDTIRSRLLAHWTHASASGLGSVTHYSGEICADPQKREAQLVETLGLKRRAPAPEWHDSPTPTKTEWNVQESS